MPRDLGQTLEPEETGGASRGRRRILFVASEIFPLAKSGGLADVCSALPAALARLGADVHLVMPAYEQALDLADKPRRAGSLDGVMGHDRVGIVNARMPDTGLPVSLIDVPELYCDGGGLYQHADGSDRANNAQRFGVLSHAAARLAVGDGPTAWQPDIVHCHDWHTGLVPMLLRELGGAGRPATVFTVHNMAFQGLFPWGTLETLHLPAASDLYQGIEFYGRLSFLKAGLHFADYLTTVSRTYAREIQTPGYGCGLEAVVRARADRLAGIVNGIDSGFWGPVENPALAAGYSRRDMTGKRLCKRALQHDLGLVEAAEAPLLTFVGRLTSQKMADVLRDVLPDILARGADRQFALLGQGERGLERDFLDLAAAYPGRVAVQIGYSEDRAQRLHAGGDILIHGSRFEPCGLTQLYAMRFGTIPVVRNVGGLADTVVDASEAALAAGHATGVSFDAPTVEAMLAATERAVELYRQPLVWRRLQAAAMACDFNWERSAQEYLGIYEQIAPRQGSAFTDEAMKEIA